MIPPDRRSRDKRAPTAFEDEILRILAEEEERFRRGVTTLRGTYWSRVAYRLAKARGATRPSPVPGKPNITDVFRKRFTVAVGRLVAAGFLTRKLIWDREKRPRFSLGYHLHNLRGRDIVLTEAGRERVRAWQAAAAPPPAPFTYVFDPPRAAPRPKRSATSTPPGFYDYWVR